MYEVIESKYHKRKYLIVISDSKKDEEFLVSEDLMVEYRLVKGKELDKKQYLKFKEASKRDEIYQKVLHYALYKQRCTYDIKQYLDKKEVYQERQKYYLEKLRKSRILDDKNYTYNYIHEAFEFKKSGPKKIIYDLSRKKISEELYQPIIDALSNED
ncbi:MAG: RecX family transcriptional regulator, partial [Tenericutes bacterium]|nr:RecX family transcriptional regulator [Mycoplasmatota bacterium]